MIGPQASEREPAADCALVRPLVHTSTVIIFFFEQYTSTVIHMAHGRGEIILSPCHYITIHAMIHATNGADYRLNPHFLPSSPSLSPSIPHPPILCHVHLPHLPIMAHQLANPTAGTCLKYKHTKENQCLRS